MARPVPIPSSTTGTASSPTLFTARGSASITTERRPTIPLTALVRAPRPLSTPASPTASGSASHLASLFNSSPALLCPLRLMYNTQTTHLHTYTHSLVCARAYILLVHAHEPG